MRRPSYSYDVLDDSHNEIQVEFQHPDGAYPQGEINGNENFHFQIEQDENQNPYQQDNIQENGEKMGYGKIIHPKDNINLNPDEININTGAQAHEKYSSVNLDSYAKRH